MENLESKNKEGAIQTRHKDKSEVVVINWILENIEAIAIAFLFALLIRCYFAEVFKIPTVSMNPTLHGDKISGDKIVVSKFAYNFLPLQRWDVVVFRYPLDMKKNFVKRLIGLPGEIIYFSDGDIFYKKPGEKEFKLAKKPLRIQQSIWLPCAVFDEDFTSFYDAWENDNASINIPPDYKSVSISSNSRSKILFKNVKFEIDKYESKIETKNISDEIKDSKIELSGKILNNKGKLSIFLILSNKNKFVLTISNNNILFSHLSKSDNIYENILEKKLNATVQKNDYFHIEFIHYDGTVYALLNEKIILAYPYRNTLDEYSSTIEDNEIYISLEDFSINLEQLSVWNDIYYSPGEKIKLQDNKIMVKEDHFFVIGDNVKHSKDSRVWEMTILKMRDGTVYQFDNDTRNVNKTGRYIKVSRDIYGRNLFIDTDEIVEEKTISVPFIPKDAVIGKAFSIILPIERIRLIK